MGEAKAQSKVFALHCGTVADALNFEGFGISFGDADDHVVDHRACHAVGCLCGLLFIAAGNVNNAVLDFYGNVLHQRHGKFAVLALDDDLAFLDFYAGTLRDCDGFTS